MVYLLLVAFSVILPVNSYGATYFVAKTGSNNNSCSAAQNPATPRLTIGAGIGCLASGDTLSVAAGSYTEQVNGGNMASGSSWTNTTKLIGAGVGSTRIVVPSNGHGLYFFNARQYLEFDGFEIDGNNYAGHNGINIDAPASNLRFKNMRVHHVKNQGIAGAGSASFLEFYQIEVHNVGTGGSCYQTGGYCHGLYIDSDNVLVDGCSLHDNDGLGVQWYPSVNNVVMKNCVVYNNPGYAGIFVGAGSKNVKIYNNTVYGNKSRGISGGVNSSIEFRNNIAFNNGTNIECGSAICTNNLTVDPKFRNISAADLRLQADSPAIDSGMTLAEVKTDVFGTMRPQGKAYDIGAYEYVGSELDFPLRAPTDLRVTAN